MSDLTAIIKTFERPRCCRRLVDSLTRLFPQMAIIVADDSENPDPAAAGPHRNVKHLILPFDVGLSAGRNYALQQVQTPFVLVLDDDFEADEFTRPDEMIRAAEGAKFDIVGGRVNDYARHWCWWFLDYDEQTGILYQSHRPTEVVWNTIPCDMVRNFFVARVEFLRSFGAWDESVKLGEHLPFFLDVQREGGKVGLCLNSEIGHHHGDGYTDRYRRFRNRGAAQSQRILREKYGIRKVQQRKWTMLRSS